MGVLASTSPVHSKQVLSTVHSADVVSWASCLHSWVEDHSNLDILARRERQQVTSKASASASLSKVDQLQKPLGQVVHSSPHLKLSDDCTIWYFCDQLLPASYRFSFNQWPLHPRLLFPSQPLVSIHRIKAAERTGQEKLWKRDGSSIPRRLYAHTLGELSMCFIMKCQAFW